MRKKLSLVAISLMISVAASRDTHGQEPEGWISTYHGGTGDGFERPVGIAVDAEGAVYVSGSSGRGATTVKYNARGALLWSAHSQDGYAVAMVLDSSGNLLVGKNTDNRAVIVKYDSDGNETEVVHLDRRLLMAIAIDATDHLFTVSYTESRGVLTTTKYDPQLDRLWSRSIDVSRDSWGYALGLYLDLDDEGHPHIAGTFLTFDPNGPGVLFDTTAVKYDSDGHQVWMARDLPVHESFVTHGVTTDKDRNLFVVGSVDACDDGLGPGFALVKYDPEGNVLWTSCYEPTNPGYAWPTAIAADASGSVYVTGASCPAPGCYTTIKYDPDGALVWEAELPGGFPAAMAIDQGGAVIVTGREESCQGGDCLTTFRTVKYDPDGRELWIRRLEDPPENDAYAGVVTLDAVGDVYVAGTASEDYGVVKYDAEGNEGWRGFYNTRLEREDSPVGIAVAEDGHVYVAGNSCDPEGCDLATLKVDPRGNVVWEKRLEDVTATAMTLDVNGDVYVTGWSRTSRVRQSLTVKYGAAGEELWSSRVSDIVPRAIGTDLEGNVYVAGDENRNRVLVKYDSEGTDLWSARSEGGRFTTMEVDPYGYVYIAERFRLAWSYTHSIVLFDQDGDEIWRAVYGDPQSTRTELHDLTLDSSGNVYATGYVWSCNPNCEYVQVTAKYNPDGEQEWTVRLPDQNLRSRSAVLKADADNNVYVSVGSCAGDSCELITAKYSSDGTEVWLGRTRGIARLGSIELDSTGNLYINGDGTTVKYDSDGNELWIMDLPGVGESFLALGPERVYVAGSLNEDYVIVKDIGDAFYLEPDVGQAPLDVTVRAPELTAPAGAGATTHEWDFGDGEKAAGESADHKYAEVGSFELELSSSNALIETRKLRWVNIACPGGDVAPWTSTDVGSTGYEGGARIENVDGSASLHICTGGIDIRGTEDSFHFVYQELSGDVVLTARVSELMDDRARVGVMLRERPEPASRHASVVLYETSTRTSLRLIYREETARRTRNSPSEPTEVPDAWVRIRRQGNEFIGSSSVDGVEWIELGRVALDLPEKIFVGFAASARVNPPRSPVDPISVRFDHLELTLDPAPLEQLFQRGDANADGDVNLTDATVILGALFGGRAEAVSCEKSADGNDNGTVEISDAVYLLAHLFRGGPAPEEPFGACGVDPTADSLTCLSYAGCE